MPKQKPSIVAIVWHQFLPAQYGGQQRIADLYTALSAVSNLTVLCSKANQLPDTLPYVVLPILPVGKAQIVHPTVVYRIYQYCKQHQPDYILVEHCYHALAAWLVHRWLHIPVLHHAHNIEYLRFKQLRKTGWQMLHWQEKKLSRMALLNLYISHADAEHANTYFGLRPTQSFVLPHAVQVKDLSQRAAAKAALRAQYKIAPTQKILLFTGTLDYAPNARAVKAIAEKIVPLLLANDFSFVVLITGRIVDDAYRYLLSIRSENCIITGHVPDIQSYFLAADVFINPVEIGGGVQTKNLEALSYQLPVVCFEHMLHGIATESVGNCIWPCAAADWAAFVQQIIRAVQIEPQISPAFFVEHSYAAVPKLLQNLQERKQVQASL